jgi:hypothetical protein
MVFFKTILEYHILEYKALFIDIVFLTKFHLKWQARSIVRPRAQKNFGLDQSFQYLKKLQSRQNHDFEY